MPTPADHTPPQTVTGRLRAFHPGWYASVMGTAVVGIVVYQDPGSVEALLTPARVLGTAIVALSAVLALAVGVPYVGRWLLHRDAALADLRNPLVGALYGTFPGGLLVLAVAITTVGTSTSAAEVVRAASGVLTLVGALLAVAVSITFAHLLFTAREVVPGVVNGAWLIPPVVTIVIPLALVPVIAPQAPGDAATLLAIAYGFLGIGLVLFLLVASLLYGRLVFSAPAPTQRAPSLWIVLGPVGVGALVLLRLAQVGGPVWADGASAVSLVSAIGATALWGFELWWLVIALLLLAGYLRRGALPFGIGWWAFTFPLGAFTASTLAVARASHSGAIEAFGVLLAIMVTGAWIVVAAGTVRAMKTGAAWQR